ncbi:male sterility protein-domain-containing protein [Penicillium argentinense]|uniref:Fatty acyl-CoA reductase n=1 Tax=Penicillium argentinense TaxID=1131581 RepID=A0A9W9KE72_9EURO|nr:male sterility protein-domain-containing protein [Penicillium argentinense]KAJ5102463.1 male sterility protein-domain-containing protein [Penicillium argentinense]
MWERYRGKHILITGDSGFLGTTLVYRLLDKTSVAHLYLVCRKGISNLREVWVQWLPELIVRKMLNPERVTVLTGDILKLNLGLSGSELDILRDKINIVVHGASSINLVHPLYRLSQSITGASERLTNLALQFAKLERFVYVSSAYANTHLYHATPSGDVLVEESIHPLSDEASNTQLEWNEVQKKGSRAEFRSHNFPWAYGYAKHLTERLLFDKFAQENFSDTLFILRPSIIDPAQSYLYPGFSFPLSTPMHIFTAAACLTSLFSAGVATRHENPEKEATNDVVPVDVVVDRLLAHLAAQTLEPVHAVSGARARRELGVVWRKKLHPIARLYKIMGTSILFSENKTVTLMEHCCDEELWDLELFTKPVSLLQGHSLLKHHVWYCMDWMRKKRFFARFAMKLLYRKYKVKEPRKEILKRCSCSCPEVKVQ